LLFGICCRVDCFVIVFVCVYFYVYFEYLLFDGVCKIDVLVVCVVELG